MAFLPLRFSGTDREGPEQGRSGGVRFAPARGRDGSGPAFPTGRGEACAAAVLPGRSRGRERWAGHNGPVSIGKGLPAGGGGHGGRCAQKKPLRFPARAKYGGPSGTRTPNQLIKSQLLYQLS